MKVKIVISDEVFKKVEEFAEQRVGGSADLYKSRGEFRKIKVFEDIVIGTLGEYGICQYLSSFGLECSMPDLQIYKKGEKSYSPDLMYGSLRIHVKSQSTMSSKRYGNSWLCQRHDKLVTDPDASDVLAFTCVDIDTKTVTILGFTYAADIKKNDLWQECKVPSYRRTKVALYLQNFEEYGIIRANI